MSAITDIGRRSGKIRDIKKRAERRCAATASLWKLYPKHTKKYKGKNKTPSLNLNINSLGSFHDPKSPKRTTHSTKETPPHAFFSKGFRASMTVEASLVLPMFLVFFLMLGSNLEILRLHSKVEMALWEIGRETCVYGTALKSSGWLGVGKGDGTLAESLGDFVLSTAYVKGRVEAALGDAYLSEAPIKKDLGWFHTFGGSLLGEGDVVEMSVTYQVEPKWSLRGFRVFMMRNHYFGRAWTGFDLEDPESGIFYLAEYAEVFHRDVACSYLKREPRLVSAAALATEVNERGSHYRACSLCIKDPAVTEFWITPEGDCHHEKRDCPGLKRTIRTVTWSEAKKYRPCSRCGYEEGERK